LIVGPETGFVPDTFVKTAGCLDPDLKSDTLEKSGHPELHYALTFAIQMWLNMTLIIPVDKPP
jgi:hypothetical protein